MTAPGLDQNAQVQVMELIQGRELLLIAPLIASFVVGGRRGLQSRMPRRVSCTSNLDWRPGHATPSHGTWTARPTNSSRTQAREQRMQEDTSVRSSSDGCAKVKA